MTIGGGCPQSCTFCPSRKTPSFSRPDFATFELLKSLSDFSPRHRFYVDLLHADPLADKSYSSVSDYASLFIDTSDTKYVTRIQTRLALLKNYNPAHFQALNTRLIYIGLETISSEVSKRSRKYNNSSFDFVDLADIYRSEGIYLRANLIIGLPDEPDDYIDRLVDFANEYPLLIGNICPYRPIPGTPDGDNIISSQVPRRSHTDYPSTYSYTDMLHDDYSISFMSRYDMKLDSPALQYLPNKRLHERYCEAYYRILSASQQSFVSISNSLIG